MSARRDWDARTYERVAAPQASWAAEQLTRLALNGDEVILDAGCGAGNITAELVERVPHGHVYGVDAAPSMAALAAQRLGDRATVLCQDLLELALPEPVDVVFSNATLHWVLDHDALFVRLHDALAPGGRLVAQCGAHGNVSRVRAAAMAVAREEPYAPCFAGFREPWTFATPAETEPRLQRAGFADVRVWTVERPTAPEDPREFCRASILVRHLDVVPETLREGYLDAVMARLGTPVVYDYVRLNILATRPERPAASEPRR